MKTSPKRLSMVLAAALATQALFIHATRAQPADFDLAVDHERPVLAPLAYMKFCNRNPQDCQSGGQDSARPVADEEADMLVAVNRTINAAIVPVHKHTDNAGDDWELNPSRGDCNDYAISKRHALLSRGWPARSLLLAVVLTSWGEPHLVLLARAGREVYVLDNLAASLRRERNTSYTWIKRQSVENPNRWVSMTPDWSVVRVADRATVRPGG